MTSLLLVCTGNICRSPSADGVLRHKLKAAGFSHTKVDSAGTHSYHVGEVPDVRSQATAKARNYDLSDIRARQVSNDDYYNFDIIYALDASHYKNLTALAPSDATAKVQMFHTQDIPDPYYGTQTDFEHVLDLIETACDIIVEGLR